MDHLNLFNVMDYEGTVSVYTPLLEKSLNIQKVSVYKIVLSLRKILVNGKERNSTWVSNIIRIATIGKKLLYPIRNLPSWIVAHIL